MAKQKTESTALVAHDTADADDRILATAERIFVRRVTIAGGDAKNADFHASESLRQAKEFWSAADAD